MNVSSRTPEGLPNHCPICHSEIRIECSVPWGDAPCPQCGSLLWFVVSSENARFYELDSVEPIRDRLEGLLADLEERFRANTDELGSISGKLKRDSLDVVEIVMMLEDHQIHFPTIAQDLPQINTIGDSVDYVVRNPRDD